MKKKHFILILCCSLAVMMVACKKNVHDSSYKGETQLIIGGDFEQSAVGDSIVFSFGEYDLATTEAQIKLNVRISGDVSDKDREFKVGIVDSLSNALPGEYELPTGLKIPAGQVSSSFTFKVKRTARLANEIARVVLQVVPNEEFVPGLQKIGIPTTVAANLAPIVINYGPSYKVVWTDLILKPSTWDIAGIGMRGYVGLWSAVKHKLMIDASGIRNFATLTVPEKYKVQSLATKYLADYNAANPNNQLKSESGTFIRICPGASCP